MESRINQAVKFHKMGYNCAQAVVCTYCDLFGVDPQIAFRFSEGFGGGMGNMRDGTCGAVTAMYMLAGLKNSIEPEQKPLTKAGTYANVRELSDAFKAKNKTTLCSDLVGKGDPALKHSCDECIADAAKIVEDLLICL